MYERNSVILTEGWACKRVRLESDIKNFKLYAAVCGKGEGMLLPGVQVFMA